MNFTVRPGSPPFPSETLLIILSQAEQRDLPPHAQHLKTPLPTFCSLPVVTFGSQQQIMQHVLMVLTSETPTSVAPVAIAQPDLSTTSTVSRVLFLLIVAAIHYNPDQIFWFPVL